VSNLKVTISPGSNANSLDNCTLSGISKSILRHPLAYLYYLPFCSVFTSKDNFHAEIVPLFLTSEQTFVNGIELKEELAKLVAYYESLPEDILKTGLILFAAHPPEDTTFLVTRLWDKYLPRWREIKDMPKPPHDPEEEKRLVEEINRQTDSPELQPCDEHDIDKMDYATIRRMVYPKKGRWLRFSEEQIQRISEHEKQKPEATATEAGR
jgi:hypothetical protein